MALVLHMQAKWQRANVLCQSRAKKLLTNANVGPQRKIALSVKGYFKYETTIRKHTPILNLKTKLFKKQILPGSKYFDVLDQLSRDTQEQTWRDVSKKNKGCKIQMIEAYGHWTIRGFISHTFCEMGRVFSFILTPN